jgi:hypothetical protein
LNLFISIPSLEFEDVEGERRRKKGGGGGEEGLTKILPITPSS